MIRILPFLLLLAAMFAFPQEVIVSALNGLSLWVNYILPALFPFFILSDLLMKQGFVHFLGLLLEPLMRPLFRLPGKAAFVLAMTHTSGIPIGAMLTCKLRKEGDLTRAEGERLLAFSSNPSPGFMFGAVASGMLGNASLGLVIAGSVYLANLIVGLLFRFYGQTQPGRRSRQPFAQAWEEITLIQNKNKKPIGEMLAEAVRESTSTILMVGGFIVFFSVITHLLSVVHITAYLSHWLSFISRGFLTLSGSDALIQGTLETTLGCKAAINGFSSLSAQVGVLCFLLGWGGISVFAQVASFTASTDLRFFPFVLGRILHAFLAFFISQLLLAWSKIPTMNLPILFIDSPHRWLLSLRWSALFFLGSIFVLLLLGLYFKKRKAY